MLFRRTTVSIRARLFGGLAGDAGWENYDPDRGITIQVPKGTRIGRVAKRLRLPDRRGLAYFVNGEKAGLGTRLRDNCEIVCLRPSVGG